MISFPGKGICKSFNLPGLIVLLGILLFLPAPSVAAAGNPITQGDELLEKADLNLPQVRMAMKLFEKAQPGAQEERLGRLIRLARSSFLAGELAGKEERREYYRQGQAYAEQIIKEQPARVEGHYWLALNLCGHADSKRNMESLQMLPRIMEELQTALAADESYDQAGPHRSLGRIYYEAPGWPMSVGDPEKSRRHLSDAVRLAPENSTNHLYLAETLIKLQCYNQALVELNLVISSTKNSQGAQELEKDREKAQQLLVEGRRFWWPKGRCLPRSPAS